MRSWQESIGLRHRLRFATLPDEGAGAALVPLTREASERKITRVTLERACRALAAGQMTR